MKLAKLLGAGKSFFGGHDEVAYRENKRVYLPKFNDAESNPFAPKMKDATSTEVKPVSALAEATSAPVVAAKTAAEMQAAALQTPIKPVMPKLARTGWADKFNPFRAPQVAAALPQVATVQPELSLDAVKVLHNDLSDADVEVVPVKSRPAAPAAKAGGDGDFMGEPVLRTI